MEKKQKQCKKVTLVRGDNGFGFTLRHFVVFPSEQEKNIDAKPLETIFVQSVNKGGSAEKFGLQEGDRILSINGQSVSGVDYKNVVELVKLSIDKLDLLLVSKEEDILQMAYPASFLPIKPRLDPVDRKHPKERPYLDPPGYYKKQHNPQPTQNHSANKNNSNRIEFAKFQQNYYDTLDSAYSTGESSYNTVDSSYTQHATSDYGSLGNKWREPKKNKDPLSAQQRLYPGSAFKVVVPNSLKFRYADELNNSDSDTATETETDTETPKPYQGYNIQDEENMSYVPDYVRPMLTSPVSVSTVTTPTASFTTSRPVQTLTLTSPSTSVTSSNITSPTSSIKDVSFGEEVLSPRGTSLYKRGHRNTSYTGYREDYVRKQKDILCGKKSLEERLKSLESGAAVKLQVSKGSQKRRRRTDASSGEVTPSKAPENSPFNVIPRPTGHNEPKSPFSKDIQLEPVPTKAPQPDIIESNQPRPVTQDQSQQHSSEDVTNLPGDNRPTNTHLTQPQLSSNTQSDQSQINPIVDHPETNRNLEPVSIKWNLASPPTRRKNSLELVEALSEEPVKPIENTMLLSEPPKDPQPAKKFGWRKPSAEALSRMKDAQEEADTDPIPLTQEPDEEINTATVVDSPPPPKPEVPKVQMRSPSKEGALQRSGAPPPLILDVTTDTAVVPVELRSPRGEGGAFPRANMRGKRNARVFMLPSSDDSEADNVLSNIKMAVDQKPVHVAPVKFVPSVLRNRSRDPNKDVSSSASSSVTDVASSGRDVGDTPSTTPSMDRKETSKRKSSRSPKRTAAKSHSSRSRSAHDQPQPTHKHSRQMSSDSQPSSTSERKYRSQQQSSNTKSRSNSTHGETKQPSSPRTKTKYNDEYEELTNTRRTTPRTMRKFQEMTNLPSPRQQAVAHAVKFGFPGNEGVIPYIDDAISPEEQQKSSQHHYRSASAGANADPEVIRRALPLSRGSKRGRMRRRRSRSPNRRTSYMEAMESSEDLTPDPDTDGSTYSIVRTSSGKDYRLSKFGRSNSADSILSTVEPIQKVVMRRVKRSNSADRNSIKAIHRRSYQIATSPNTAATPDQDQLRTPVHKRQPSIRKLKNFFGESTPQIVEAQVDEGRRGSRALYIQPVPTLELNEYDDTVIREGFLFFKVATIEKGKRTSSQKLWKTIWVVLKEQMLYLCKDWSRTKQETSAPVMNGSPHNTSGSQPPSQLVLEEEEPLNIQGSLVSIAYNYTKRRNVFKVTTGVGSEYLFQAEDRDDMLAWINSIQVSGNHDNEDGEVIINEDLILRKTNQHESGPKPDKRTGRKSRSPKTVRRAQLPLKDVDGSRRFKWRGSVNRIVRKFGQGQTLMQGQTFDVHLEDCPPSPNNECVPYVVELCCRVVEERGLNFMGIYRVPGNSGTLAALQDELNCKGPDNIDFDADERFLELNVISSLLKSFFRKLPDPLFTNKLYDDFIAMNRKKDSEERLNGLRRLIHMLPAPHYETLKFLVAHLKRVSDNADVNKMEVRNLAIVFGPTLVRSTISDNMATMVTDMSDQCRIVESVLQHAEWFFAENKDEGEAKTILLPPPPAEEHHEPVPNINHLLVNVGRTPGDESDSTESSKSKNSLASEKESFSRDVMDMLLGVRKRWLNNQAGGTRKDGGSESDDEYGFKEAERRQARAAVERKMKSDDSNDEQVNTQPSSYQVAKAAASELRAAQASKDQHLPHDIQNRLYDFYVEHLERLARTEMSRLPPQFTSSSETSPQVTPRHSNIYVPPPAVLRPLRRSSDSTDPRASKEHPNPKRHFSSPPSSPPQSLRHLHTGPVLYGESPLNRRYNKHPVGHDFRAALATSTPMHGEPTKRPAVAKRGGNVSELSSISREDVRVHESESDSDTSIYVGDTLEEKLKNLTNLDKKLERRPSRRYAKPDIGEPPWGGQNGGMNGGAGKGKRLTAPSHRAGEPVSVGLKKSTREIYQERRAMRQQQREQVKASRGSGKPLRRDANDAMSRCASDENVFSRGDPKRQHVRSPVAHEEKQNRRPSTDRVRRRHTLGGNDFPGQDFWAKDDQDEFYGSLQNVSATSRLKPRVLQPKPDRVQAHWRVDLTSLRTKHKQNTKKSESYI